VNSIDSSPGACKRIANPENRAFLTYLYTLPPGTPKEPVQILRHAFDQTMKDPEFLAEAKKANLDLAPVSGEELEKIVAGLFKLEPTIVGRLKEILE